MMQQRHTSASDPHVASIPRPRKRPQHTTGLQTIFVLAGGVALLVIMVSAGILPVSVLTSVAVGGDAPPSTPPATLSPHQQSPAPRASAAPHLTTPPPQAMRLDLDFPPELEKAWKTYTGEKGQVFAGASSRLSVEGVEHSVTVRFWGKSSKRLRLTKRRSLDISSSTPVNGMTRFLLMSLWEDEHRLAYITAARFLKQTHLWTPAVRMVELRCVGQTKYCPRTFGMYLLIHFPVEAIASTAPHLPSDYVSCMEGWGRKPDHIIPHSTVGSPLVIGARVWRYHPKPAFYDVIDFPSFASNSSLSTTYRSIAQGRRVEEVVHMPSYLLWLALNSLLQNGDYDDEVFLIAQMAHGQPQTPFLVHAWDYDTIFQECHKNGKHAIKNQPLFYCAESDIDRIVVKTPHMMQEYRETLHCVLHTIGTPRKWNTFLTESLNEVQTLAALPGVAEASYEGKPVPDFTAGAKQLTDAFSRRWGFLRSALGKTEGNQWLATGGKEVAVDQKRTAEAGEGKVHSADLPRCTHAKIKAEYKLTAQFAGEEVVSFSDGAVRVGMSGGSVGSGLHCVVDGGCFAVAVVRDKERGGAEWGVPPFQRVLAPPTLILPHRFEGEEEVLSPSTPPSSPYPVVFLGDGVWEGERHAFPYHHGAVMAGATPLKHPVAVETRRVEREGGVPLKCKEKWGKKGCVVFIDDVVTVPKGKTVTIPSGATLTFGSNGRIDVLGTLVIGGEGGVTTLAAAERGVWWGGVVVRGKVEGSRVLVSGTGGTHYPRDKSTGKHRKEAPAFSVLPGGSLTLDRAGVVECHGPGFGAGKGASVNLTRVLMQGVQQGGECVGCSFSCDLTTITDVPNRRDSEYVDGDNDGLYLSGGDHTVHRSVIAYTADDGIDSGTATKTTAKPPYPNEGVLRVTNSIIDACQHEGLALSGVTRKVSVRNTVVSRSQQGIELGYTTPGHEAVVTRSLVLNNMVGVRYGDNYRIPNEGSLSVSHSIITGSVLDVLNLVRKTGTPSPRLTVSHSILASPPTPLSKCRVNSTGAGSQGNRFSEVVLTPDGRYSSDPSVGLEGL